MKLKPGHAYMCENGVCVIVQKNNSEYCKYNFYCVQAAQNGKPVEVNEVFTEDGESRFDSGYNIVF